MRAWVLRRQYRSRSDDEPWVFVGELKRTRRLENKAANIECLVDLIRNPQMHVPPSPAAECWLPSSSKKAGGNSYIVDFCDITASPINLVRQLAHDPKDDRAGTHLRQHFIQYQHITELWGIVVLIGVVLEHQCMIVITSNQMKVRLSCFLHIWNMRFSDKMISMVD